MLRYLLLLSFVIFSFVSNSLAQSQLELNPSCAYVIFFSSTQIRSNMRSLQNATLTVASKINLRSARETSTELCQALASESPYVSSFAPSTFKALLSLNSSGTIHADDQGKPAHAKDYVPIEGPVCNMQGEIVANSAAEFWSSSHLAKMNTNEYGEDTASSSAWTGSTEKGVYSSSSCAGRPTCNCYNWTSTKDESHGGNTGRACARDSRWALGAWRDASHDSSGCRRSDGRHNSPCGGYQSLYCLGRANYIRMRLPEQHGF